MWKSIYSQCFGVLRWIRIKYCICLPHWWLALILLLVHIDLQLKIEHGLYKNYMLGSTKILLHRLPWRQFKYILLNYLIYSQDFSWSSFSFHFIDRGGGKRLELSGSFPCSSDDGSVFQDNYWISEPDTEGVGHGRIPVPRQMQSLEEVRERGKQYFHLMRLYF